MKESGYNSGSALYVGLCENGLRRAAKGAECEVNGCVNSLWSSYVW